MSKNRFYIFVIAGLLISNVLLVAFILMKKETQHSGPRNIIIERLNFDENQVQKYDELIMQHRHQISGNEHEMMDIKRQYYLLLNNNNDQKKEDSLINEIGKISMKTEKINFKHFQDIKKICHPDQIKNFNDLINDLGRLFNRSDKPPH